MCDPNGNRPTQIGAVVRPILAAMPYGGSALATLWSEWDTSRRFSRVEEAVEHLANGLAELGQKFAPESIGDEELQLLEEVLRRIQIEHRERKRQRFVQLLTGAWTTQRDRPFDENLRYLRALEQFSDLHIDALRFLADQKAKLNCPSFKEIADHLGVTGSDQSETLLPALNELVSEYGFVKRAWNMTWNAKTGKFEQIGQPTPNTRLITTKNLSPEGIARTCNHVITDAGTRFLVAIQETTETGTTVDGQDTVSETRPESTSE